MIMFWMIAAVFVAIALGFVLPPLLQPEVADSEDEDLETNVAVYRDQLSELDADLQSGIISADQYQQDRDEVERRLLSDVSVPPETKNETAKPGAPRLGPVYAIAVGIPLVAVGLYYLIGNPNVISGRGVPVFPVSNRSQPLQQNAAIAGGEQTQERMEANVAALAQRLEKSPRDLDGWTMLARSYSSMGKYAEASDAYARATALKSDDADLWADYALAKTMANDHQMKGEPMELVNKSLKLDPENPKALQLSGGAAFQEKRYQEAVSIWERVYKKLPPESELAQALKSKIDEARSLSTTNK